MNTVEYDIGIYHRQDDRMSRRILNVNQVLRSVSWLKSQNFTDHDIYIRPNDSVGLVFFDDLNISGLNTMKSDGVEPCIVVQSSPHNYQGWIRVSDTPIDKVLSTRICKLIAKRYGRDMNSADWRHYGRLAEFTNRKREYINDKGQYPFVLLSETSSVVPKENRSLIDATRAEMENDKQLPFNVVPDVLSYTGDSDAAERFYLEQIENLKLRFGHEFDCSIADWWLVKSFVGQGVPKEEVKEILLRNSPVLETRKNNRAYKYLEVTLEKAYHAI